MNRRLATITRCILLASAVLVACVAATHAAGGRDSVKKLFRREAVKKFFDGQDRKDLEKVGGDLAKLKAQREALEREHNQLEPGPAKNLAACQMKELDKQEKVLKEIVEFLKLKPALPEGGRKKAEEEIKVRKEHLKCLKDGKEWSEEEQVCQEAAAQPPKKHTANVSSNTDKKTDPSKPDAARPPSNPPATQTPAAGSLAPATGASGNRAAVLGGGAGSNPPPAGRSADPAPPKSDPTPNATAAAATPPPDPTGATLSGTVKNRRDRRLKGVLVKLQCENNGDIPSTISDANGEFKFERVPEAECKVSTEMEGYQDAQLKGIDVSGNGEKPLGTFYLEKLTEGTGEFSRAIVGFEQAGASASSSTQKFFFDFFVSTPAPYKMHRTTSSLFGPHLRFWGDVRVTSVPQQIQSTLGQFAISFTQQVSDLKVNEVAQANELLAGIEYRIGERKVPLPSFDHETKNRFTVNFVLSAGTITPLTPRDSLQVFKVPKKDAEPAFFTQPETQGVDFTNKDFVAFATRDRDRFFRQYYAGFRLKTFYFNNAGNPIQRFPAMLDVMVGQNEAVTGGRLRGAVIRLEGFFPLPFESAKYIYLFGTGLVKPTKAKIREAIILEPAPQGTTVPASNVVILSVPQINRDYYRLGVGIDAISLFQFIKDKNKEKPAP